MTKGKLIEFHHLDGTVSLERVETLLPVVKRITPVQVWSPDTSPPAISVERAYVLTETHVPSPTEWERRVVFYYQEF